MTLRCNPGELHVDLWGPVMLRVWFSFQKLNKANKYGKRRIHMVAVRRMLLTPVRICNFTKRHQIITESSNKIQRWSRHQMSALLYSSPNICLPSLPLCLPPGCRRCSPDANVTIKCCPNSWVLCLIFFSLCLTLKWKCHLHVAISTAAANLELMIISSKKSSHWTDFNFQFCEP